MDIDHDSDIVQQARGVIAARLDVDIETAALILDRVAHREKVGRDELAADVVASCTNSVVGLPRDLYTYESAT